MNSSRKVSGLPGRRSLLVFVAGCVWVSIVGAGFCLLAQEEFTPVRTVAAAPASFPANSALHLAADRLTLLLFVHPKCPCTRATLHELDGILAGVREPMAVSVIFTVPAGLPPNWERGSLWDAAAALPGVDLLRDLAGREASRFGVTGSGHALLFAPSGRLLFSGGITASRGHEGDNAGRAAILNLALHGAAACDRAPVFGCPLL